MREPLVPASMWTVFTSAASNPDTTDGESELYQAISELPQPNRDTMAFLMLHFQKVAAAKETKMSPSCPSQTGTLWPSSCSTSRRWPPPRRPRCRRAAPAKQGHYGLPHAPLPEGGRRQGDQDVAEQPGEDPGPHRDRVQQPGGLAGGDHEGGGGAGRGHGEAAGHHQRLLGHLPH